MVPTWKAGQGIGAVRYTVHAMAPCRAGGVTNHVIDHATYLASISLPRGGWKEVIIKSRTGSNDLIFACTSEQV